VGLFKKIIVETRRDTAKLAGKVARLIKKPIIVALKGDLGAGKTFFAKCLVNDLLRKNGLPRINVVSPTFNLVKIYNANDFLIYHYDLYRLNKREEIYELDIEEALENITIIEWPEIIEDILPKGTIVITITVEGNTRIFDIKMKMD
jgi:tRNA threonylcarbamoyladenosine biosynthesis protein TsaE